MKKQLSPVAMFGTIAAAVVVIGGLIWMLLRGTDNAGNEPSLEMQQKQMDTQKGLVNGYIQGSQGMGGEAEARQQHPGGAR